MGRRVLPWDRTGRHATSKVDPRVGHVPVKRGGGSQDGNPINWEEHDRQPDYVDLTLVGSGSGSGSDEEEDGGDLGETSVVPETVTESEASTWTLG
jgi:hypothetical protein